MRERARWLGLRWVHLLQGGALMTPYYLLVMVAIGIGNPRVQPFASTPSWQFVGLGLALPLVAATAVLFPFIRPLEATTARTLACVPGATLDASPARSWAARWRTSAWFTLHAGLGAVLSGATLAVPPMAVVLCAYPFSEAVRVRYWGWPWNLDGGMVWTAPPAGLALLLALTACAYGAGALLARCAPPLLGPTPEDRLAAAERRAAELAQRNRLARELHDSVGHALSAVSLQAGAARRLLDSDRDFVREALAAIEETSRGAVAELDAVLGVLRGGADSAERAEGEAARPPTLAAGLDGLLARSRATGAAIDLDLGPGMEPLDGLPDEASRAAFRIVQEGLSNALRHAEGAPVRIRLTRRQTRARQHGRNGRKGEELEIDVRNPLTGGATGHVPAVSAVRAATGGRGLPGIAERAELLGGSAAAGARDGVWRLTAQLPLVAEARQERQEDAR
ncbi:sensor histidine kinase [Streptomyces albiaxialis]|uniref:sensor histidine kinase n=1 Tax=Streptomyces albiaxialis TaxID=329523 RepID=UPI003CD08C36